MATRIHPCTELCSSLEFIEGRILYMGVDPYTSGMITAPPRFAHVSPQGSVVAVLEAMREERGLDLIPQRTRCIRAHEIHEILLTDQPDVKPGAVVNKIASLAFVHFGQGGVLVEGDVLSWRGRTVGGVVGFDETHAPNHMNIVVKTKQRASGLDLGIQLGDDLLFAPPLETEQEAKDA